MCSSTKSVGGCGATLFLLWAIWKINGSFSREENITHSQPLFPHNTLDIGEKISVYKPASLRGIVWPFWKHTYSPSRREVDERIDSDSRFQVFYLWVIVHNYRQEAESDRKTDSNLILTTSKRIANSNHNKHLKSEHYSRNAASPESHPLKCTPSSCSMKLISI